MSQSKQKIETRLIHAGEPRPGIQGAVSMPIFQSSTFQYSGQDDYHDLKYIRLNNTPNHIALHLKLAAVENAEAAVVTGSGMAAIATTLLTMLKPGDHILAQDCLYGGTHDLLTQDLKALGIAFDFIDGNRPESWADSVRPNTRLLYCETITNPLMQVADLPALAQFAESRGLVSVIDNTFASPVNFRPAEWGFDLSIHSCTKYLNGHSDIVAGAVIGKNDLVEQIIRKLNHLGGTLDPHACFLLHRGMKTLAVRVRHQNRTAGKMAEFLAGHPAVEAVFHPGLPGCLGHETAKRILNGFGGMLGFELKGGVSAAEKFFQKVSFPVVAPSLGGPETLVTRPATTSHAGMSPEDRKAAGIKDSLVRVSIGLEAAEDLIDDFDQAL